jgi:regulator of nucleoside diphosphate kinase
MLKRIDETRPPIILTTADRNRLTALVAAFPPGSETACFLGEELARAEIIERAEIGLGVATMHSYVEFIDDVAGRVERATLVYPGEEDRRLGRINVLSPTGAALLGLCEGQSIRWRDDSGRWHGLTLLTVLVQHWRAPPSSWAELGRMARMSESSASRVLRP